MKSSIKRNVPNSDGEGRETGAPKAADGSTLRDLNTWKADHVAEEAEARAVKDQAGSGIVEQINKTWSDFRSLIVKRQSTAIKSALALAALVLFGWFPAQRLLSTTSAEAVVNARVITLRAPIEGEVSSRIQGFEIGARFASGQEILSITNLRSDRANLSHLRRQRDQSQTQLNALEVRRSVLLERKKLLTVQQDRFREGRIVQVTKRLSELDTEIAAQTARLLAASRALDRGKVLDKAGFMARSGFDQVVRDEQVAKSNLAGLRERHKGMTVELEAARSGTYVGDSYNDTPQSAQRILDVELEISDIGARIDGTRSELAASQAELDEEAKRQDQRSKAVVQSSVSGRVWEVLTAPGEYVNAGQDLVRLLDCSQTIVTASVSETTYHKLSLGQRATFTPRSGPALNDGYIVGLNGLSAVPSNSAIKQHVLTREPFHVTLKFPDAAADKTCLVGHTGLVTFQSGAPQAAGVAVATGPGPAP